MKKNNSKGNIGFNCVSNLKTLIDVCTTGTGLSKAGKAALIFFFFISEQEPQNNYAISTFIAEILSAVAVKQPKPNLSNFDVKYDIYQKFGDII
jgi:hypothetical protein